MSSKYHGKKDFNKYFQSKTGSITGTFGYGYPEAGGFHSRKKDALILSGKLSPNQKKESFQSGTSPRDLASITIDLYFKLIPMTFSSLFNDPLGLMKYDGRIKNISGTIKCRGHYLGTDACQAAEEEPTELNVLLDAQALDQKDRPLDQKYHIRLRQNPMANLDYKLDVKAHKSFWSKSQYDVHLNISGDLLSSHAGTWNLDYSFGGNKNCNYKFDEVIFF